MRVDAEAYGGILRRMPSLAGPGLSERAQAALAQAVLLAAVPPTARQTVPDQALAEFAIGPAPTLPPDALADPWAQRPLVPGPATPVAPDPRTRAIAAATAAPQAPTTVAAIPAVPQPRTAEARLAAEHLARAEAAKASLGAAVAGLLEKPEPAAAAALDRARAAAGQLVQAQAAALAAAEAPRPLQRMPAVAPPHCDVVPTEFAAADAVLARMQDGAGAAASPEGLFALLATVRAALAGLWPVAADPLAQAVAQPIAALAPVRGHVPNLAPRPVAPALVAARPVPLPQGTPRLPPEIPASLPAVPAGWGLRANPAALPLAAEAMPQQPAAAPFDATTAGALAGIAAAAGLMRRNGFGDLRDPGALDGLAEAIESLDDATQDLPPLDPDDYDRLMQWGGLARQAAMLRSQTGLVAWDPGQQPALAEALQGRARWLAERPPWPGREQATDGLTRWLPLVDCAEALGLPTRGHGALRTLGRALRATAATGLPRPRDPVRLARDLSALDAVASLHETLGTDPGSAAGVARLEAMARGLEGLPAPPGAATAGALDCSGLERLRGLDRSQAAALGLEALSGSEIPLLSSGLPVLAALDAGRRLAGRPVTWPGEGRPRCQG